MTAQPTRWLEYGEPIGNQRVEAWVRTTYQTGPQDPPREDEVERGTLSFEGLNVLDSDEDISRHIHDDGSLLLSGLPAETEDRLMQHFEPADELELFIRQGCSPAEAVDYLMVEGRGWTQSAWSDVRGVGQGSVSENISKAKDHIHK